MFSFFINSFAIGLSVSTALGIFVHDTKIDKFTLTALALPAAVAGYEASAKLAHLSPDLHTHAERTSIAQAVHDLRAQNPRIQPRHNDDKKHLLQRHAARGHFSFDTYNVPLV